MKIQEQIQIVEDNLKEYGQCNITIEEFNYLKDELYSSGCLAGIELGKADMLKEIEEGMYTQCFERDNDEDMQKWDGGNWFRYKLFENVLEQLKEKSNE